MMVRLNGNGSSVAGHFRNLLRFHIFSNTQWILNEFSNLFGIANFACIILGRVVA